MPEFYGSQRLFWYLIVAVTLNSASLGVLTYFLYMRAKAGSTAVWHFFAVFERCLPAWWKEKRLEAERESVAQLVTSAIALGYLLHSLTLISGPALFDDGDPSVRKGGIHTTSRSRRSSSRSASSPGTCPKIWSSGRTFTCTTSRRCWRPSRRRQVTSTRRARSRGPSSSATSGCCTPSGASP